MTDSELRRSCRAADMRRHGGAVALVLVLAACHTMQAVPTTQLDTERAPQRLWVTTRAADTPILVEAPVLSGDTLSALLHGEPVQFLLSETTSLRAREASPIRTALLVGVVGGVTLGTLLYLESRPDVGSQGVFANCTYGLIGTLTNPCCQGAPDSVPC